MDLELGSNQFVAVKIPVLWGKRAILQDRQGRISVIDLSGEEARAEIVGDEPAPDVEFTPTVDGLKILKNGSAIYEYSRSERSFASLSLDLPDLKISEQKIQIGTNTIERSMVVGSDVGVRVSPEGGFGIGGSIPEDLAALKL